MTSVQKLSCWPGPESPSTREYWFQGPALDELPGATDIIEYEAAWGPGVVWGLGACERESQVQTCKALLVLEKQLDAEYVLRGAIGSSLLPKEGNADRFFVLFFQTSTLALLNLPNIHFLLIENELHISHKFFLLMIVLFASVSESTDNCVILGSHSKSGKEKLWRYLQGGSSHLSESRYSSIMVIMSGMILGEVSRTLLGL